MRRLLLTLPILLLPMASILGQERPPLTAQDYARAEQRLGTTMNRAVEGQTSRETWMDDGRLWYRRSTGDGGGEYLLVDPRRRTRQPAFDHTALARTLSIAADTTVSATELALQDLKPAAEGLELTFAVGRRRFVCASPAGTCTAIPTTDRSAPPRNSVVSPDGTRAAFVRDHNLWVRDLATGQETRLTTDGVEDFGYATNNAGWVKSDMPVLVWSPDSRRIATFQHDGRAVGMMYLVNSRVGHPELEAWKYPLPGDSAIFTIHRVIIDVPTARVIRLQMPPDAHRSSVCDHVVCGRTWSDVAWYPDGSHLAFVSSSRDHKVATLRIAAAETGTVRDVFEERVATQYESGFNQENWRVLPASNEFVWFSQRDDWGNLYLHDLTTGALKHQITRGPGPVLQLLRVDERARTLTYTAAGREAGRDPYFQHLYTIGFDGKRQTLLTPEDANHAVTPAPGGEWFVDRWSTPVTPPTTVLRDARGRLVMTLETTDLARLMALGWQPPMPFTVKARDGVTDLYGLMYRPSQFDSTKRYPVLNYLYPGPQTGSVGSRNFSAARGDKQAVAELGFIVVEVDAMGTPMRSKSFHDAYYGNMGDNGLPDQVAMLRQLGARHSWMDLDRVGIWGHSGGGFASTAGILRYPNVYKVAVSQAGNHDNRTYEDDWGERYQGLLVENPDGSSNYDDQANQLHAENLRGKLLIAHGSMDNNVPPNNTLVLVDALMKANKDFDLLLLPNRRHGFGNEPYMMRRRWDYFVRHLLGVEPPQGYEIGAARPLVP